MRSILTVYSKEAVNLLEVLDSVVLKYADSKVLAASTTALFNDANHDDETMCSITIENILDIEEMKKSIPDNLKDVCFVCEENPNDWLV